MNGPRPYPAHLAALRNCLRSVATIAFEPDFLSQAETKRWLCTWTGNPQLTGLEFRIFARKMRVGHYALWLKENRTVNDAAIVLFTERGDARVLADSIADWVAIVRCYGDDYLAVYDEASVPTSASEWPTDEIDHLNWVTVDATAALARARSANGSFAAAIYASSGDAPKTPTPEQLR